MALNVSAVAEWLTVFVCGSVYVYAELDWIGRVKAPYPFKAP